MLEWFVGSGSESWLVQLGDWGAIIGSWIKESFLWLFDVFITWAMLLLSDWFSYLFSLINVSGFPVLSQLSGWILVLNGWIPLDFGFQLFFAYWTVAIPLAALRLVFKLIPFIG